MLNDCRVALRQLRHAPGFTLTALLTLALGIGATTAIFTLVYNVMLRPLPFANPDRLVTISEIAAEWRDLYPTLPDSANHFTFWQQHSHSFAAMALMREYPMPFGAGGRPMQVDVLTATPGIFSVLQMQPALGRAFTPGEAQPGHARVAILTDSFWRQQFGADPSILGKSFHLDGYPVSVIGVMPATFHMPAVEVLDSGTRARVRSLGLIVPLGFSKDLLAETMGDLNYFGLARLKPGVSVAAANAELNAEQHTLSASLPADEKATLSAQLTPWQQQLVGSNRRPLLILLAAVAGLLLVGCVNIANLLLARAVGQRQQMAVAAALGASRTDLLRLSMRETTLLSVAGCSLGILLAAAAVPAMQRFLPPALDFRGPLHLDWAGALCALLLALLAAIFAGLAPAWNGSRTAPQEVLHSESRLATESRSSRRMRNSLVAIEVAVSLTLVLMTGLVTLSIIRLMHVDRGFDVERTLAARLQLPAENYSSRQKRAEFYKEVISRVQALPGVSHAAIISVLPMSGEGWGDMAQVPGDTRPWTKLPLEQFRWVSPDLFATLHLRLIQGHPFTESDEGRNVAVVTERTGQALWKGKSPLGQQFRLGGRPEMKPFTVVGVVADARTVSLDQADPMVVYVPYWYRCDGSAGLLVRTRQNPAAIADSIRRAVWSVDAGVPVPALRTLGGLVAESVANRRFEMDLLLLFAASAILLAGLGVYGVVTYSVVQRQREIGLRLALGAQRSNIYVLILRDGLAPVLSGALGGIALSLVLSRLVRSLLFDVSPWDPAIAASALLLLVVVGALSCLFPARRAVAVDPMAALRGE